MVIAKSLWGKLASLQALLLFASFNTDGSGLNCKVMHCQPTNKIENVLWVVENASPGKKKSFDQEPHGRQQLSSGGPASLSIQDFSVRTRFQCLDLSTWLWQIVPLAHPPVTCFPLNQWLHQNNRAARQQGYMLVHLAPICWGAVVFVCFIVARCFLDGRLYENWWLCAASWGSFS